MDRDKMTVGMEVEHRNSPHGNWQPGKIIKIDDESILPITVDIGLRWPVLRNYDEIELPGTAARIRRHR